MRTYELLLSGLLLITASPSYADINALQRGVAVTNANLQELSTTTTPDAYSYGISWLSQESVGDKTVNAFLRVVGTTDLYSLSSTNKLHKTNFDTRKNLGNWPLTRWQYQYYPEEKKERYLTEGLDPESIGRPLYTAGFNSVGCLSNTPLRYGQLVSGGENYIVLLLNDQFIIFSPQYERTVFAEYLNNSDWYSAEETASTVTRWHRAKQQYQYMSKFLAGVSLPTEEPGYRFYVKLYVDDFDKDGNPDIVVWRKMYETNRIENPTLGFTLLRNEWQHYEQDLNAQEKSEQGITGEYLPQTTDEATIKTWLADNALTWKKGYPDVSECAADNGGPIPEMSDPLLNDPEVLQ